MHHTTTTEITAGGNWPAIGTSAKINRELLVDTVKTGLWHSELGRLCLKIGNHTAAATNYWMDVEDWIHNQQMDSFRIQLPLAGEEIWKQLRSTQTPSIVILKNILETDSLWHWAEAEITLDTVARWAAHEPELTAEINAWIAARMNIFELHMSAITNPAVQKHNLHNLKQLTTLIPDHKIHPKILSQLL